MLLAIPIFPMKYTPLTIILAISVTLFGQTAEAKRSRHQKPRSQRHIVKLELYTSEKCPNDEFAKRTRMTNYYTPVMSPSKCKNGQLGLLNYNEKEKTGSVC